MDNDNLRLFRDFERLSLEQKREILRQWKLSEKWCAGCGEVLESLKRYCPNCGLLNPDFDAEDFTLFFGATLDQLKLEDCTPEGHADSEIQSNYCMNCGVRLPKKDAPETQEPESLTQ